VGNVKRSPYWELKKGSVYDGDTFRVINPTTGEEIKIRMACIDAPEKKQDLGIASRDYLRSLLNKNPNQLIIQKVDTDRYGRTVALVFVPDGNKEIAVNADMVQHGMAYFYRQYAKNCEQKDVYEAAEKSAIASKVGVWKYNSMKPWEYRKAKRND
jgi:endonuclease YncB( thermonuclease family)